MSMNFKSLALSFLGIALFTSCATHRAYENELGYWEGKPVQKLLSHWGLPAKVSSLEDGGRLYLFEKRNEDKLNVRRSPGSEKIVPLYDCRTSFLANRDGVVTAWRYEGHACQVQDKK